MNLLRLTLFLVLGGCASIGPVTVGANYTTPEGATIGGSVRIDPTYAKQK